MWSKKTKFSYIVIILVIILIFMKNYSNGKKGEIKFFSDNDKYYYTISKDNGGTYIERNVTNLNQININRYDKETLKKERVSIDFSYGNDRLINYEEAKDFGEWIIMKTIDMKKIVGIDTEEAKAVTLEELVANGEPYHNIKDMAINDNSLIYTYVADDKTVVEAKNIESDESIKLVEVNSIEEIPISAYKNKVSYILKDKIYVYDLSQKEIIFETAGEPAYHNEVLIYEDKIYSLKNSGFYSSLVVLDYDKNEKVILENVTSLGEFYLNNDRVVFNDYFYDIKKQELYIRGDASSWSNKKLMVDDYILNQDNEYEKKELNKNYFKYPLKADIFNARAYDIGNNEEARVLYNGEVVITDNKSGKIVNDFKGITPYEIGSIGYIACRNNKLYALDRNEENKVNLISLDLSRGAMDVIGEVNTKENIIGRILVNDNEVAYLSKKSNDDVTTDITIYNLESKKETKGNYNFNMADINNILFNDKYIVALKYSGTLLTVYDRETLEPVAERSGVTNIIGITNEGIVIEHSTMYGKELVDFKLEKIKTFSNFNKVEKYIEKNEGILGF